MFNYNHLYYFYVTAREGGVTRAAAVLKISQPSLSSQLRILEREVGKALFVKVGRKLELSDDGRLMYAHCKQMFEVAGELSRAIRLTTRYDRTRLHVAVSDEVERPFAATYLSHLFDSRELDHLSIRMISGRHGAMLDDLDKNQTDLLLTNYSADERDFETVASIKMPVHCLASPRFIDRVNLGLKKGQLGKLNQKAVIDLLAKTRLPVALPTEDQKLRQEIHYFFEQNSLSPPVVFQSNALAAVLRSATEGLGFTFLPAGYAARELKTKQLMQIGAKPLWSHSLNLICKPHLANDPIVKHARFAFGEMTSQA